MGQPVTTPVDARHPVPARARMHHPVMMLPDAMQGLQLLNDAAEKGGVPTRTLALVHMRASQINGCSLCFDMHRQFLKDAGESDEHLRAVASWRETRYFTAAECAALALTEAVTHLSDPDPVPDDLWEEAARHYDERALAALLIAIVTSNAWNRLNVATRQVAEATAG